MAAARGSLRSRSYRGDRGNCTSQTSCLAMASVRSAIAASWSPSSLERRGGGSGGREPALPIVPGSRRGWRALPSLGRRRHTRTRAGSAPPAGGRPEASATCRSSRVTASAARPSPSNAFARHSQASMNVRIQRDRGTGHRVGRGKAALRYEDLGLPDPRDQRSRLQLERPGDPLVRGAVVAQAAGEQSVPSPRRGDRRVERESAAEACLGPATLAQQRVRVAQRGVRLGDGRVHGDGAPRGGDRAVSRSPWYCPARTPEARPGPWRAKPAPGRTADLAPRLARRARSPAGARARPRRLNSSLPLEEERVGLGVGGLGPGRGGSGRAGRAIRAVLRRRCARSRPAPRTRSSAAGRTSRSSARRRRWPTAASC